MHSIRISSLAVAILISVTAMQAQRKIATEQYKLSKNQVFFTENKGQVGNQYHQPRPDVLFTTAAGGMVAHLRKDGLSYQQYRVDRWEAENDRQHTGTKDSVPAAVTTYRTDINWIGTRSDFKMETGTARPGYENYYLAVCPDGVTGVRSYESVTYSNIYQGIDVKWYSREGVLEYDFVITPGADYRQIRWEVAGAEKLSVGPSGELVIQTPLGEVRELAPVALQEGKEIQVQWQLQGKEVGFLLKQYDASKTLVIDPVVREWGTYYGGSQYDYAYGCKSDKAGNIYLTGRTTSLAFIATSGSHQSTWEGYNDSFLAKFNRGGSRLWATYYGGAQQDFAVDCEIDNSSFVYVAGLTNSASFIATAGSHQDSKGGLRDAYLVKFDSNGVRQWGTYYGGASDDEGFRCTLDGSSNVYLTGYTESSTAIATAGSYQDAINGSKDAFLVKFNNKGVRLWGTYYGGASDDVGNDCVTDGFMNLYLAGETASNNSIATVGSYQDNIKGDQDAFLVKFDSNGVRQWGTYYGGDSLEYGNSCVTDKSLNVYLSGETNSFVDVSSSGSYQHIYGGGSDAFLVKFNNSGSRAWATYYGGPEREGLWECMVDDAGDIYIAGETSSGTNIATHGTYQDTLGGLADGFMAKFDGSGSRMWGTYFGGEDYDAIVSCEITESSKIYIAGITASNTNISTNGSHQVNYAGGDYDGFLVKFQQVVGLEEKSTTTDDLIIYPNPTYNRLNLSWKQTQERIDLYLYNAVGQLLSNWQFKNSQQQELELVFPPGLYLLKISTDEKTYVKQLIKQ